jgi:hypothetical protein
MTRKLNRNYSLIVVVASVAILALLIAAAVRAQTSSADRPSGQANTMLAPAGASAPAQAERPLSPWTGAGSSPVSRSETKRHGAHPMDGNQPSFLPVVTYNTGGYESNSVAVADVNGDGKPDLVIANCGSCNGSPARDASVSVLLGNGDGTFQAAGAYGTGELQQASSVVVADVNGDGKPDLLVANAFGVGVLLGNGDGTFQTPVNYGSGGGPPWSVAVADVNGDGKPDLVVTNSGNATVGVLLGNGDGTFQGVVTYGTGGVWPDSVAIADVNGDGKPDLVVANMCLAFGTCNGFVGVLLGNGDGTFLPAVAYSSGGFNAVSLAVADVNRDGKPDVLVVNELDNTVGVLLGDGDGTFQPVVTYGTGGPVGQEGDATSVAVADVNGDGNLDLVVANACINNNNYCVDQGTVGVLLGNGDGTFQSAVTFGSGGYMNWSVAVADVNGDGKPDLLVANQCADNPLDCTQASVGVLLNNISGPKTPTTTTLTSSENPARFHKPVTYTAIVTGQNGGVATGSVTLQDGGSNIATIPLANNQAAYSTTYTKGGSHKITAVYSGDLSNLGSTSLPLMEYIESAVSRTVVTTSGSPSLVGQPVTFTATVTSTHGAIPDGELVTFYDGKLAIGTGTTAGGVATFTTSSLKAETHSIKATYAGDDTFEPSTGLVRQVVDKYTTTTALSSSPNPSNYGQAVTFTATVTSSGPNTPTGKVEFKDGTKLMASVTLSAGIATLTRSNLAVGTHPITAKYTGDYDCADSTSSVLDQVVE